MKHSGERSVQDQREGTAPAVIALAGRRIDAPDAKEARFPPDAVPRVRDRLATLLPEERAEALVCSGACGADLIALEEADRLGLRRIVVLPFAPGRFRETSVIDRPGDWGPRFDRVIADVGAAGDLVVLNGGPDDESAYAAANQAIIGQAQALSHLASDGGHRRLVAIVVWEGQARSGSDATEAFRRLAANAGFTDRTVLTR